MSDEIQAAAAWQGWDRTTSYWARTRIGTMAVQHNGRHTVWSLLQR